MNLDAVQQLIDDTPDKITAIRDDFDALAAHAQLPPGSDRTLYAVQKQLYSLIAASFPSGHNTLWQLFRDMQKEMILKHIVDGTPIDPYFAVLDALREGVRNRVDDTGNISGDWSAAIQHAVDHARLSLPQPMATLKRVYCCEFVVAEAAKRLKDCGYALQRNGASVALEDTSETKLVEKLEKLIAKMGGVYVAARIFASVAHLYDAKQERYHIVQRTSSTGGARPQVPLGYLTHLAAKHVTKPVDPSEAGWQRLVTLATHYAAILDVQNYSPSIWRQPDAKSLLKFMQETALSDTLFRLPQIRGSDVPKILAGVLKDFDPDRPYGRGWTINDAISVAHAILDHTKDKRGPVAIKMANIVALCDGMEEDRVVIIVDDVLSHPPAGPNTKFLRPADAPHPGLPDAQRVGHDLIFRPLLRPADGGYAILDRAISAPAFLESLLSSLRVDHPDLDQRIGIPLERFVAAQLLLHGVATARGTYVSGGETGECDLVVESEKTIFFLEFKKKALTRAGQAGVDANIVLDLANSLLDAQIQAGWHEVRIRRQGFLDLQADGNTYRLELRDRTVERLALSFLDFGSFQDRVLIQQFLAANLGAKYTVNLPALQPRFDRLNYHLETLQKQTKELLGGKQVHWPFFNCWFLSVPQLLVLLDDVTNVKEFHDVFFCKKALALDVSDLYYFHSKYGSSRQ